MIKLNNNAKWGRNPASRQALVRELVSLHGPIVNRKQVLDFLVSTNRTVNDVSWLLNGLPFRSSRGAYTLASLLDNSLESEEIAQASA